MKKNTKITINSKKEYHEIMLAIYEIMNKSNGKLTKSDKTKLTNMSIAAEEFEDNVLGLKPIKEIKTIPQIVSLKLFEYKMTQANLAQEIGIKASKVSEILNGKRKADIIFLKGIHKILKVDANILLEMA